jgi:Tetratricopeptide repeat
VNRLRRQAPEPGWRDWLARGNALLNEQRFDDAAVAFRRGFDAHPDPRFILNEAAALLMGGRHAEADLAYGRYLADADAPRAEEARAAQAYARSLGAGCGAATAGLAVAHRKNPPQ